MWYKIINIIYWFGEMNERYRLVRDFNKAGQDAFITGLAPTLLKARITFGDNSYRHAFSKYFGGGFRIKALSGRPLSSTEQVEIGRVILYNDELVRKLVTLGWDTLEVHDDTGYHGHKWSLKEYAKIGYLIN